MNMDRILDQLIGANSAVSPIKDDTSGFAARLGSLATNIPGGLVGGAAAGSLMALLINNKSARKFAGTAASYGGAAILGGLAYKALRTWQHKGANDGSVSTAEPMPSSEFELRLVKAMIAAAKADGNIDASEQQKIFEVVERMSLSAEMKGMMFDLLTRPIALEELVNGVGEMTQRSQLYLVSCMVIDPDHAGEQAHLHQLAAKLELPRDLAMQIEMQAKQAGNEVT